MPAPRVCPRPGCPNFQPCPDHKRPGPRQRGYDRTHDKRRAQWTPRVATGQVTCWRCGEHITATEPWDLGHDDVDRSVTRGPEHAARCNRSAAGRAAHGT